MAVAVLSAPERRKDTGSDNNSAGAFALLLVQEWLVACKLASTAQCLVDECARSERDIPATMVWNRMVESLGFGPRTLVRRVVEQHEKEIAQTLRSHAMVPQQQVVVMSKKRELKFVGKRSLPRSNNNASDRTPELSRSASSLGLRPKSAMICKSTSDLISKASSTESSIVEQDLRCRLRAHTAQSLAGAEKDCSSFWNSTIRSPTPSSALHAVMGTAGAVTKPIAHHNSAVGLRASLPHITEITGPATSPRVDEGEESPKQNADEVPSQQSPKLSLEEMSEERLMEQFGSISRCAIKKLRRVLAKSHAYSQEFEKSQRTVDKIKARAKLRQLRRVLAEEQTPLLTSTMRLSRVNRVHSASSWAAANETTTSSDEAAQQTAEGMTHARMTHLYDEAPVCVFCSQLVLNSSSYRPSSAERRAQHARERFESLKSLKDLEAKERHDLEKCDPLDYHSFELNSDDDDSDVEEVVEVKTDGRPQVVRRRRRQTLRTPVQLGVVSKRLHYDHLRSDSLHMLTLDEWKIMR
ncbi:hypothetical protein GQ600_2903 [Phytophthora cactorum]|nr:hypothetical protein GQ600_2903 [Phytophthora cactorum]